MRTANIEGKITMHTIGRARHLVLNGFGCGGGGLGVGHFKNARHAAHHGGQ